MSEKSAQHRIGLVLPGGLVLSGVISWVLTTARRLRELGAPAVVLAFSRERSRQMPCDVAGLDLLPMGRLPERPTDLASLVGAALKARKLLPMVVVPLAKIFPVQVGP